MSIHYDYAVIEDAHLKRQTDSAALFVIDGHEQWIPWSLIDEGSVDRTGKTGTIYVAEWFANQEGIT